MSFENAFLMHCLPPNKHAIFLSVKSLKLRNIALDPGFCGSYWISESVSLLSFG